MGLQSSSNKSKKKKSGPQYTVICRCGEQMRVRTKQFGRMCKCTHCDFPIYVTYDSVSPAVDPHDKMIPKFYDEHEVPINWKVGELITELYQVKEILGQGGMGTVYRLEHRGWGKMLAVKCPSSSLMNDPVWVNQFEHECETWINLSPHPNVVECYYLRRMGGLPRLFVEYVDGPDLDQLISEKTLYEGGHEEALKRILDIAIQMCRGLHHAHHEGLVHQDVKPTNVLVGEDGVAKVMDFGLAMVFVGADGSRGSQGSHGSRGSHPSGGSDMDAKQVRGSTGGTPAYRSNDHKVYDTMTHHTDIWSLGVTMIEMFSGDVYWTDGRKAMSVLDNLLKHGSRYDVVPKMPAPLQTLLRECFNENRDKRPADMKVIAESLKAIYAEESGEEYPRAEVELNYTHVDILNNRAVSLLDLGQIEEAEALWVEVLKENPAHIEALYNRGLLYWRSGRITDTQMLDMIQGVCEAYPNEWLPRYLSAQVCMERGDCTTAMDILEPLTRLEEYNRDVSYCQSMAYHFHRQDKRSVWHSTPENLMVTAVGFSGNGQRVLVGGSKGEIYVFDASTQCEVGNFIGHQARIHSLTFAKHDEMLVTACADKTVRVWNTEEGKCRHVLKGHRGVVRKAAVTVEADCIVSVCDEGMVIAWDPESGDQLWQQKLHAAAVWDVCISHCGRYVFTAGMDGMVIQWDRATGKGLRRFSDQSKYICLAVAVNREGTLLYIGCGSTLQTWDLASGELLGTIPAHQHDVAGLALSKDGIHAVSGTIQGTLKAWNLETGQCIRSFHGHAPLALSTTGEQVIFAGAHSDFFLWNLYLEDQGFRAAPMICR